MLILKFDFNYKHLDIKEFIPNAEIGLGIKFADSLYGLFSLRDVKNIEKINKKTAEALGKS